MFSSFFTYKLLNDDDSSLPGIIYPALSLILKNISRKHRELYDECNTMIESIKDQDSRYKPGDPVDVDGSKYFHVLKLACEVDKAKVRATALDAIHKLLSNRYLLGNTEVDPQLYPPISKRGNTNSGNASLSPSTSSIGDEGGRPSEAGVEATQSAPGEANTRQTLKKRYLIDVIIETIYNNAVYVDDNVQLSVLKCLLTAITSSSTKVHDHSLVLSIIACFHIYITSYNQTNRTTAKATLIQIVTISFKRMDTMLTSITALESEINRKIKQFHINQDALRSATTATSTLEPAAVVVEAEIGSATTSVSSTEASETVESIIGLKDEDGEENDDNDGIIHPAVSTVDEPSDSDESNQDAVEAINTPNDDAQDIDIEPAHGEGDDIPVSASHDSHDNDSQDEKQIVSDETEENSSPELIPAPDTTDSATTAADIEEIVDNHDDDQPLEQEEEPDGEGEGQTTNSISQELIEDHTSEDDHDHDDDNKTDEDKAGPLPAPPTLPTFISPGQAGEHGPQTHYTPEIEEMIANYNYQKQQLMIFQADCFKILRNLGRQGSRPLNNPPELHQYRNKILTLELFAAILKSPGPLLTTALPFLSILRREVISTLSICILSSSEDLFKLAIQIFSYLLLFFREQLKLEIGLFFKHVLLEILTHPNSTFQHKTSILDVLVPILRNKYLTLELFLNYDYNVDILHAKLSPALKTVKVTKQRKKVHVNVENEDTEQSTSLPIPSIPPSTDESKQQDGSTDAQGVATPTSMTTTSGETEITVGSTNDDSENTNTTIPSSAQDETESTATSPQINDIANAPIALPSETETAASTTPLVPSETAELEPTLSTMPSLSASPTSTYEEREDTITPEQGQRELDELFLHPPQHKMYPLALLHDILASLLTVIRTNNVSENWILRSEDQQLKSLCIECVNSVVRSMLSYSTDVIHDNYHHEYIQYITHGHGLDLLSDEDDGDGGHFMGLPGNLSPSGKSGTSPSGASGSGKLDNTASGSNSLSDSLAIFDEATQQHMRETTIMAMSPHLIFNHRNVARVDDSTLHQLVYPVILSTPPLYISKILQYSNDICELQPNADDNIINRVKYNPNELNVTVFDKQSKWVDTFIEKFQHITTLEEFLHLNDMILLTSQQSMNVTTTPAPDQRMASLGDIFATSQNVSPRIVDQPDLSSSATAAAGPRPPESFEHFIDYHRVDQLRTLPHPQSIQIGPVMKQFCALLLQHKARYIWSRCTELFNTDYSKGLKAFAHFKLLDINDPRVLANFIYHNPQLDKSSIGELIGGVSRLSQETLLCFLTYFDFRGLSLDAALRKYLYAFRMPGESQYVSRLMKAFSRAYCDQNDTPFRHPDTVFTLAFSLVILNTDAHSGNVEKKMTKNEFIVNNRAIDEGHDLPFEYLSELYDNILQNEIKMKKDEQLSQVKLSNRRRLALFVADGVDIHDKLLSTYQSCMEVLNADIIAPSVPPQHFNLSLFPHPPSRQHSLQYYIDTFGTTPDSSDPANEPLTPRRHQDPQDDKDNGRILTPQEVLQRDYMRLNPYDISRLLIDRNMISPNCIVRAIQGKTSPYCQYVRVSKDHLPAIGLMHEYLSEVISQCYYAVFDITSTSYHAIDSITESTKEKVKTIQRAAAKAAAVAASSSSSGTASMSSRGSNPLDSLGKGSSSHRSAASLFGKLGEDGGSSSSNSTATPAPPPISTPRTIQQQITVGNTLITLSSLLAYNNPALHVGGMNLSNTLPCAVQALPPNSQRFTTTNNTFTTGPITQNINFDSILIKQSLDGLKYAVKFAHILHQPLTSELYMRTLYQSSIIYIPALQPSYLQNTLYVVEPGSTNQYSSILGDYNNQTGMRRYDANENEHEEGLSELQSHYRHIVKRYRDMFLLRPSALEQHIAQDSQVDGQQHPTSVNRGDHSTSNPSDPQPMLSTSSMINMIILRSQYNKYLDHQRIPSTVSPSTPLPPYLDTLTTPTSLYSTTPMTNPLHYAPYLLSLFRSRSVEALKTLLNIATSHGNHVLASYRYIFHTLTWYNQLQLISEDDNDDLGRNSLNTSGHYHGNASHDSARLFGGQNHGDATPAIYNFHGQSNAANQGGNQVVLYPYSILTANNGQQVLNQLQQQHTQQQQLLVRQLQLILNNPQQYDVLFNGQCALPLSVSDSSSEILVDSKAAPQPLQTLGNSWNTILYGTLRQHERIHTSYIDKLFTQTASLHDQDLLMMLKYMVDACHYELHIIQPPSRFLTQKLVEVMYYNKSRSTVVLTHMWLIVSELLCVGGCHPHSLTAIYIIDIIRQLISTYLPTTTKSSLLLTSLMFAPFEFVLHYYTTVVSAYGGDNHPSQRQQQPQRTGGHPSGSSSSATTHGSDICDLALNCLTQIAYTSPQHIHSGWRYILNMITYVSKDLSSPTVLINNAFKLLHFILSDHFALITTTNTSPYKMQRVSSSTTVSPQQQQSTQGKADSGSGKPSSPTATSAEAASSASPSSSPSSCYLSQDILDNLTNTTPMLLEVQYNSILECVMCVSSFCTVFDQDVSINGVSFLGRCAAYLSVLTTQFTSMSENIHDYSNEIALINYHLTTPAVVSSTEELSLSPFTQSKVEVDVGESGEKVTDTMSPPPSPSVTQSTEIVVIDGVDISQARYNDWLLVLSLQPFTLYHPYDPEHRNQSLTQLCKQQYMKQYAVQSDNDDDHTHDDELQSYQDALHGRRLTYHQQHQHRDVIAQTIEQQKEMITIARNIITHCWYLLLGRLAQVMSDRRLPVRSQALTTFDKILTNHGHIFNDSEWKSIFTSIIPSIFTCLEVFNNSTIPLVYAVPVSTSAAAATNSGSNQQQQQSEHGQSHSTTINATLTSPSPTSTAHYPQSTTNHIHLAQQHQQQHPTVVEFAQTSLFTIYSRIISIYATHHKILTSNKTQNQYLPLLLDILTRGVCNENEDVVKVTIKAYTLLFTQCYHLFNEDEFTLYMLWLYHITKLHIPYGLISTQTRSEYLQIPQYTLLEKNAPNFDVVIYNDKQIAFDQFVGFEYHVDQSQYIGIAKRYYYEHQQLSSNHGLTTPRGGGTAHGGTAKSYLQLLDADNQDTLDIERQFKKGGYYYTYHTNNNIVQRALFSELYNASFISYVKQQHDAKGDSLDNQATATHDGQDIHHDDADDDDVDHYSSPSSQPGSATPVRVRPRGLAKTNGSQPQGDKGKTSDGHDGSTSPPQQSPPPVNIVYRSDVIVLKCKIQLLLIDAMNTIFSTYHQSFSESPYQQSHAKTTAVAAAAAAASGAHVVKPMEQYNRHFKDVHLLILLDTLILSIDFSKRFNSDFVLRLKLWRSGFLNREQNVVDLTTLLSRSLSCYVRVLLTRLQYQHLQAKRIKHSTGGASGSPSGGVSDYQSLQSLTTASTAVQNTQSNTEIIDITPENTPPHEYQFYHNILSRLQQVLKTVLSSYLVCCPNVPSHLINQFPHLHSQAAIAGLASTSAADLAKQTAAIAQNDCNKRLDDVIVELFHGAIGNTSIMQLYISEYYPLIAQLNTYGNDRVRSSVYRLMVTPFVCRIIDLGLSTLANNRGNPPLNNETQNDDNDDQHGQQQPSQQQSTSSSSSKKKRHK